MSDTEASRAALVDAPIDVEAVHRLVASPDCGAVVLFVGAVRRSTIDRGASPSTPARDGREVERIDYSAYRSMALARIDAIVDELESEPHDGRAATLRVAIVHRLGPVPVGEASVVIATASPHREAAYAASREALERLKKDVPIWKREHFADGDAAWREEEPLLRA